MGDVLTFTLRPKPVAAEALKPLAGADLRASLEEAAQVALDAADRIIAVLDRMDGDTDLEDGADAEPSLAAPENHTGSQVVWMRGNDADREADAPEAVLPEVGAEAITASWGGNGNVVSAAGVAIIGIISGSKFGSWRLRKIYLPEPDKPNELGERQAWQLNKYVKDYS